MRLPVWGSFASSGTKIMVERWFAATSDDGGHTFTRVPLGRSVPLAGLAEAAPGRLVLVGPRGLAMARFK